MEINKGWLISKGACTAGIDWFANQGKTDGIEIVKQLILECQYQWANWLIVRLLDSKKKKIQYAIFAAELVIDVFERKYPTDPRPRRAIEAARIHLNNPTAENKAATADAAYAAYAAADAAYAAANAAYAAANADNAAYAAANAAPINFIKLAKKCLKY